MQGASAELKAASSGSICCTATIRSAWSALQLALHDASPLQPASQSLCLPFSLVGLAPHPMHESHYTQQPIAARAHRPSWWAGSLFHACRLVYNAGKLQPVPTVVLGGQAAQFMHADCYRKHVNQSLCPLQCNGLLEQLYT